MAQTRSRPHFSPGQLVVPGAAFLLAQVGAHSARLWRELLAPLGLDPQHAALLRHLATAEGRSQQALGEALGIPPSRMVALVDDMERAGFFERRPVPGDRRVRALYLTRKGRQQLEKVMALGAQHEVKLCASLAPAERDQLIQLLDHLAEAHRLVVGVHPDIAAP